MGRKRHMPEQAIRKLREAEVELAKGQPMVKVARKLGIAEQTGQAPVGSLGSRLCGGEHFG